MRDVYQRMAPARHFDQSLRVQPRIVLGIPQAQRLGIFLGDHARLCHHFQRSGELLRVVDIEVHPGPLLRDHAPLHQRLRLQP